MYIYIYKLESSARFARASDPGPWALAWALVGPCGDRALRGPGP